MTYEPKYFKGWEDVRFSLGNGGYKPEIAWWLAQSSHLAYENKITVATELHNAGFNKVIFFDASGTQAFLATHPGVAGGGKFAVLAFRGTEEDSVDILTDIKLVKRLFPNENLVEAASQDPIARQKETKTEKLYAHGGFVEGLQNVWGSALRKDIHNILPEAECRGAPGISEAICQIDPPNTPLYFTGHSLGGALATLAAYKALIYRSNGINITALYTFGSPRTVQRPLAGAINKEFENKLFRIVNYIDLVPRLPPRIPCFLDFHHIDKLVYFKKNRNSKKTLLQRDVLLSDISVLALALLEIGYCYLTFKHYTPKTLKCHKITEYIKDIEKEVCKQQVAREQKGNH